MARGQLKKQRTGCRLPHSRSDSLRRSQPRKGAESGRASQPRRPAKGYLPPRLLALSGLTILPSTFFSILACVAKLHMPADHLASGIA